MDGDPTTVSKSFFRTDREHVPCVPMWQGLQFKAVGSR